MNQSQIITERTTRAVREDSTTDEVRIHFSRGVGIGGAFVRGWTRSEYAHVTVTTPWFSADAAPVRGVGYRDEPDCTCIALPITSVQRADLAAFIYEELYSPYDWMGDVAAGLPWAARESETAWFCSEFAAACLQSIGVLPWNIQPWRLSPQALFDILTALTFKERPHA